MTETPSTAAAGIVLQRAWIEELGATKAVIFECILRHSAPTGDWRATHAQIAEEIGLSPRTVERATRMLRDRGWLASRRSSTWDPTPVWTVTR